MNGYDDPTAKDTRKVDLLKLRLPDGSVARFFRIWSIFWLAAFASRPTQAGTLWLELWPVLVASYLFLLVAYLRRISTSPIRAMENKVQLTRLRTAKIRYEILFDLFLFVAFTLLHNYRFYMLASHWQGSLPMLALGFGLFARFADRVSGLSVEMRKIESCSLSSPETKIDHDRCERATKS
jgi:hypothetical protein